MNRGDVDCYHNSRGSLGRFVSPLVAAWYQFVKLIVSNQSTAHSVAFTSTHIRKITGT